MPGGPRAGVAFIVAASPAPCLFTARTSKVYDVPLARSVTLTCRINSVPVHSPLPSTRYSYLMMAAPPLLSGASQVSVTSPSPVSAWRARGAEGVATGVAVTVAAVPLHSSSSSPLHLFTARTSKVYDRPLING